MRCSLFDGSTYSGVKFLIFASLSHLFFHATGARLAVLMKTITYLLTKYKSYFLYYEEVLCCRCCTDTSMLTVILPHMYMNIYKKKQQTALNKESFQATRKQPKSEKPFSALVVGDETGSSVLYAN